MHICMYGNDPLMLPLPPAIFSPRDFRSCLWPSVSYPSVDLPSKTSPFSPWTLTNFWHSQHPFERVFLLVFYKSAVYHKNSHHLLLILNLVSIGNQRQIQWLHTVISNLAFSSLTSHKALKWIPSGPGIYFYSCCISVL